jgi:glycosyltransferase involved in cell wall biosynthesis
MRHVIILWNEANPSTLEKYHLIASGLAESGLKVSVINLSHTEKSYNKFLLLFGNNFKYYFDPGPQGALNNGKYKITKLLNNIRLSSILSIKLLKALFLNNDTTIIIQPAHIEIVMPAIILGKLFKTTLISNIMEYGPALPSFRKILFHRISWRLILKYSDAYIVISKFLLGKIENKKPAFYLPAIIDNEFLSITDDEKQGLAESVFNIDNHDDIPFFLFTSSSGYSDLLNFCLESLSLIKDMRFICLITGSYKDEEKTMWLEKIKKFGLKDKVKFTGFLGEKDLLLLQKKSTALLMPLLNTPQHKARFPQKILGYMRLKKPIISTKVGEIEGYFKDNINAFIDETISPAGYAEKINFVLGNAKVVSKVAQNGCRLVKNKFSYLSWGEELKTFIMKFVDNVRKCSF